MYKKLLLFFALVSSSLLLAKTPQRDVEMRLHAECTIPDFLYKIVTPEDWEKSQTSGHIPLGQIDSSFIHLSTEAQLTHVAGKFWQGKQYVVLKLNTHLLIGDLRLETNPGGQTKYFHLYDGSIPLGAVVAAELVSPPD